MSSTETAVNVITRIEVLFSKFSIPKEKERYQELVRSWAYVIDRYNYPANVWGEAVTEFFAQADSRAEPPMPGDLLRCCKSVIEQIERDPARAPKLAAWRESERDKRDAALRGRKQR